MSALEEVKQKCNLLATSTKVKERKGNLAELFALLSLDKVCQQVDRSTVNALLKPSERKKGQATWDDVVRAIVVMVESEVEHNQAAKRKNAKPPTLRKDVVEALKNALKLAEQRGPRLFLSIKDLTQHFVKMLCQGEEHQQQPFLKEYCDILCDYILPVPSYCQLASTSFFEELLTLYGEYLLSTPPSSIEHQIYARTYHCLLTHYPMELCPFFAKFGAFFMKYFSRHLEDNKPSATLLAAFNYLLQACALDEGSTVRRYGNELHAVLLKRWETRQQLLKDQIVNFFRLQLLLNISFTGKIMSTVTTSTTSTTNLTDNAAHYGMDYLDMLFDLVSKDIEKSAGQAYQLLSSNRMRQSRFNEEDPLYLEDRWRSFLDFAVDLFLHMSHRHALFSTSLSSASNEELTEDEYKRKNHDSIKAEPKSTTKPRKRQKRTDVFEMLISALPLPESNTDNSNSLLLPTLGEAGRRNSGSSMIMSDDSVNIPSSALSWLQLLTVLVRKYSYLLPPRYHMKCVESASFILGSDLSDKPEIEAWALATLISLVKTVHTTIAAGMTSIAKAETLADSPSVERAPLKKTESQRRLLDKSTVAALWQGVWKVLVRKLPHYNSGGSELALTLMKEIVENDLIDATLVRDSQGELWKCSLFNEPSKCSIAAIEFVIAFLRRHELKDIAAANWSGSEPTRLSLKRRRSSALENTEPSEGGSVSHLTQRESLLEWLMLSLHRDLSNTRQSKNMQKAISPNLVVSAIIALTRPGPPALIRDTSKVERRTPADGELSYEDHPFRTSIVSSSLGFLSGDDYDFSCPILWPSIDESGRIGELRQTEKRLKEVSRSRVLYDHHIDGAMSRSGRMETVAKGASKNQISVPLRVRLQSACIDQLRMRSDDLLALGRSLFDSAQKVKTMGLDKHKLMLVLSEMSYLCQTIVILLPALLSTPGLSSISSSSAKTDYAFLAVDVERVMSLADHCLTSLLDFIAANVPLLATHPQLLKEFLLRFYALITSWASRNTNEHTNLASSSLSSSSSISTGTASGKQHKEGDDRTQRKSRGDTESNHHQVSSATDQSLAHLAPLQPYQHLLHPLASFLIGYLSDFSAALAQNQGKDDQTLMATSSYSRSDPTDLDLMEETPVVQSPARGGRIKRESASASVDDRGTTEASSAGEVVNTLDDECILLSARSISRMALSRLCPSVDSVGSALMDLLKVTHMVDFKLELSSHLLDMCHVDSTSPRISTSTDRDSMFYEESLYPPTVSLDDSCPPSETRALATSVNEAAKVSYVKQVLTCIRRLSAQPESFGRESVRRGMLHILGCVMRLLNQKTITGVESRQSIIKTSTKLLKTFVALWEACKLSWPTRIALVECTREFLDLDEEDGEDFSEVLIKLLQDPSYQVRKHMSRAITVFFSLYPHQIQIFNDLSPTILPISKYNSEEERMTALLTLGEIACVSPDNEQRILFELCLIHGGAHETAAAANKSLKKDDKGKTKAVSDEFDFDDSICETNGAVPSSHEEIPDLVAFIIEHIRVSLSYPSTKSLLTDHLSFLLGRWCESKLPLERFPIRLLNADSFTTFLNHYASILLPKLVYLTDRENIELVAQHLGVTPEKLVLQHYPAIFAQTFPLYYSSVKEKKDLGIYICETFLPTFVSGETVNKLIPQELDTILIKLFELTKFKPSSHQEEEGGSLSIKERQEKEEEPDDEDDDDGDLYFSSENIRLVLKHLAQGFKMEIVSLFFKTKDRVQKILLHLNQRLARAHRTQDQLRAFAVLKLFIEILGDNACAASVLRDIIHTILRCISNPNLAVLSCRLLRQLAELALGKNAKRLGHHLKAIVTSIIPIAQRTQKPGHAEALSLLTYLVKQDQLKEAILHLDPFPDIAVFAEINRIYHRLRGDYHLSEEIERFIRMWAGAGTGSMAHKVAATSAISVATKTASLAHLKKLLKTSKVELIQLLKPTQMPPAVGQHQQAASQAAASQSKDAQQNLIDRLIWELVQLCAPQNDSVIQQMAGECLGELGAVDPYAISFSFPHDQAAGGEPVATKEQQMKLAKISILELLNAYLTDADVDVLHIASNCLKAVLCTNSGLSALAALSEEVKEELMPYRPSAKNAKPPGFSCAMPEVPLAASGLWSPQSYNSYNDWVSYVAYSLACHAVKDRMLHLSAPLCMKKPEFAEFLFPFLVMTIICHPDDSTVTLASVASASKVTMSLPAYISYNLRTYVLCEANTNTESIQLALHTLNILRKQFMAAHQGDDPEGSAVGGRKKGEVFKQPPEKKKGWQRFWHTDFWKDFNFLDIARAAQRCSAYLTSLLYVELWCEKEFGQLELPVDESYSQLLMLAQSSTTGDEAKFKEGTDTDYDNAPDYIHLLLEIYSNINEPDSIYGLQRNQSIHSRIKMYEHENDWGKALGAYDMSLQHSGSRPPLTQCMGLLSSLQNLGHHHLLEVYLRGFAVQYPARFLAVSEYQYAEAWRTCKWQMDWLRHPIFLDRQTEESNVEETLQGTTSSNFHMGAYHCLRSLHDGDQTVFWKNLRKTRIELVRAIGLTSLESTKSVYPALAKLQFLGEIEYAWNLRWEEERKVDSTPSPIATGLPVRTKRIPSTNEMDNLISGWRERLSLMQNNFELIEPLLSLETVLLKILAKEEYLPAQLLSFAQLARKADCFQIASNCLHQLKDIHHKDGTSHLLWRLEEARVLWDQGEGDKAINIGKQLSRSLQELYVKVTDSEAKVKGKGKAGRPASLDERLLRAYAEATYYTGKWLAETRSESSSTIIDDYLQKAVELNELFDEGNRCRAYFTLARYADGLYGHLVEKLKSSEWAMSQELRKQKERELQQCQKLLKTRPKDKDLHRHTIILQRQCEIDKSENKRLEKDREELLHSALENYLRCLLYGDKYDIRVMFRLCSLWFNNHGDPTVNLKLSKSLQEGLPSRKFVPLIYQIASRIHTIPADPTTKPLTTTDKKRARSKAVVEKVTKYVSRSKAARARLEEEEGAEEEEDDAAAKKSASFQDVLNTVIETVALDHPHHALWQIFALSNGDRVVASQKGKNRYLIDNDKATAAKDLLNRLRGTKHKQLIQEMEKLISAYIELAFLDVSAHKGETRPIPLLGSVRNVRNLSLVPVPTINLEVSADATYQDIVTVSKFSDSFSLAGGLNLPKIIECIGSDGQHYRQLVKGSDDLRQDAVMQQMFLMVNILLRENPETRKRRLRVRTYKVIPLTPCAGLLEWVQNTIPLGQYLIGTSRDNKAGAHVRYRPDDILSADCRKEMQEATTTKKRRKVFDSIMERFKPVFHHFFLEQFPDPAMWFERRLNYIRSVASSSTLGYVVGLGDRHAQNILIDRRTAEVVHIDLGVAFEQGKTLRTPEVVPFRLTRDIVDGMGITGCEGVFRRCCEETMQVLRASHEFLLTIMEVFIHDPLFKWALSPVKALQLQRDDNEQNELQEVGAETESGGSSGAGGNKDAERALLRLKAKLQGYEYGQALSVEGQVKQLIAEAQDPSRLAEMFPGWAPWL